jgi:hypothetical protein
MFEDVIFRNLWLVIPIWLLVSFLSRPGVQGRGEGTFSCRGKFRTEPVSSEGRGCGPALQSQGTARRVHRNRRDCCLLDRVANEQRSGCTRLHAIPHRGVYRCAFEDRLRECPNVLYTAVEPETRRDIGTDSVQEMAGLPRCRHRRFSFVRSVFRSFPFHGFAVAFGRVLLGGRGRTC